MKEGYLIHRNYRANLEHGTWVWSKITKKHLVGIDPDTKKPIKRAKSGNIGTNSDKMRRVTNTADYDEAVKMLDRWLDDPNNKQKKPKKDKAQTDLLSAIREAEKPNTIEP